MSNPIVDTQPEENVKEVVQKGYDTIAPAYLAWSAPRPTTTRMEYLDRLLTYLPQGARILELGCGAGVPCTQNILKHEKEFHVTGVDISQGQLDLAKEHLEPKERLDLVRSDMMALEVSPGTYDAVLAFYSIFHLPRHEQGKMIAKMASWLKTGGVVLFNLGTGEGDKFIDDWMGAKMFSSGLGVDGNREALEGLKGILEIEESVEVEMVGRFEERFHWVWGVKKV
ncbi:S-adenosyl-L-methionine-dependent methyltransferase [Cyathus striatus]|nr:S-adenosyl-L-methionine-dependent methyltransferase [Cyathus striatus]